MKYFNFGINWQDYSNRVLNESKITAAEQSLQVLLGSEYIQRRTFLDIGSGSGIFSIAAARLGAKSVIGFDSSPQSIAAAEQNRHRFAINLPITFRNRSVLDENIFNLDKSDIVYSWGVLHHTGQMWSAVDNSMRLVANWGLLVIALYNRHWTSPIWRQIKHLYNIAPKPIKQFMIYFFYCLFFGFKFLVTLKNPLTKDRGMNFYYDVIDWIGGYPYEYASTDEVIEYITSKGFVLIKLVTVAQRKNSTMLGTGCNEFVFRKMS